MRYGGNTSLNHGIKLIGIITALGILAGLPVRGQFVVKLQPQTANEFEAYVKTVEAQIEERWSGKKGFLAIEDDPVSIRKVLNGEFSIQALPNGHPTEIKNGLVHDWIGAVYIPHTAIEQVLKVLQDFNHHKEIYPEIADSRLVQRNGNDIIGYWRLERKGIIPVVLNVEEEVHYKQVAPGQWTCRAYARKITEVDTGLFKHKQTFPPGEGHGYLWRLYAYWSLKVFRGGVLAECRTLSLSRDIPAELKWAVGSYVQKTPSESLLSTLRETRKAASR